MRIDAFNQISQISQVYGPNGKMKTSNVSPASKTDKVEISSFGRDLQLAKQAVKNAPDVRADKVTDLKAKIDNGTYEVSAESFADKLLAKYDELNS